MVDHQDSLMNTANTRIPYASTLQISPLEDTEFNLFHVKNEEGDELIKMDI